MSKESGLRISMRLNPEYESAKYELRLQCLSGDLPKMFQSSPGELPANFEIPSNQIVTDPHPHRFNVLPPNDLWENGIDGAWKWISKHSIPKFIEKPPNYVEDTTSRIWWCETHQRRATHLMVREGMEVVHVCDPKSGGITFPCQARIRIKGSSQE